MPEHVRRGFSREVSRRRFASTQGRQSKKGRESKFQEQSRVQEISTVAYIPPELGGVTAGGGERPVRPVRRSRSARQKRGITPRSAPRSTRHHPSAYSSIIRTRSPTATVSSSTIDGANVCTTTMVRGRRLASFVDPAEEDEDERRTWPGFCSCCCWYANDAWRAGDSRVGEVTISVLRT